MGLREEEQGTGRLGLCHMPLWGTAASTQPAAKGDAACAPSGSGGGGVKVIRSLLPT